MSIPAHVFEETLRSLFAPVEQFLRADDVTEVLINRYDEIYVERRGRLHRTSRAFSSEYALMAALRNLSQYVGRHLDTRSPVLEARLPDGSRVEAVIPPAAPKGAAVCIRRFRPESYTFDRLVDLGAVHPSCAEVLRSAVRDRCNILIGGGSGTGKTSLLNALACLIRPVERVIVIEDSNELQLGLPHVVHFESQPPDPNGRGAISIRELLRATLRMRPDRIVIGEIRGGEALDLVQAMTSGHRGCLSTVHGTLPIDTLNRLETMALMSGIELPIAVLRAQIVSAVDIVTQVTRRDDGRRYVTHVAEVHGFDPHTGYRLEPRFEVAVEP